MPRLAGLHFTSEVIFFLLQLHEQFHRWSWSGFGKSFGKMTSLWEYIFRGLEEEPREATFLAPSHPKSLWEHVLGASQVKLFYFTPFGRKRLQTTPEAGGEVLIKF